VIPISKQSRLDITVSHVVYINAVIDVSGIRSIVREQTLHSLQIVGHEVPGVCRLTLLSAALSLPLPAEMLPGSATL